MDEYEYAVELINDGGSLIFPVPSPEHAARYVDKHPHGRVLCRLINPWVPLGLVDGDAGKHEAEDE